MQFHQSVSNTVAKRGSGSEMSKWRDAGVDPELLYEVVPENKVSTEQEKLAHLAAQQALQTTVVVERA